MNRNPKVKPARIEIRTEPAKKKKIKQLADKCNLPVSEYIVQRALGYEPKSVLPDAFYRFYSKLCDVTNELKETVTPETEARLVELVEYIHSALLLPYKKTAEEIRKETEEILTGSPQSTAVCRRMTFKRTKQRAKVKMSQIPSAIKKPCFCITQKREDCKIPDFS